MLLFHLQVFVHDVHVVAFLLLLLLLLCHMRDIM